MPAAKFLSRQSPEPYPTDQMLGTISIWFCLQMALTFASRARRVASHRPTPSSPAASSMPLSPCWCAVSTMPLMWSTCAS